MSDDTAPPTVENAARVIYEGLVMSDPPPELVSEIAGNRRTRWPDLGATSRAWLVQLVHDACVPFAEIDEPVDGAAVIVVRAAARGVQS